MLGTNMQSAGDRCVFFLIEPKTGNLRGVIYFMVEMSKNGMVEPTLKAWQVLNWRWTLHGKGDQMLPRRKFLSPSTTLCPKDQSDRLGSTEKEGEVRLLLQRRRDQPTSAAVVKSSTVGQGDTTRSGWASCDSPAIFATSLHPGHHRGKLPGSGSGETCGSGYHRHPIPLKYLPVGTVSDASWETSNMW